MFKLNQEAGFALVADGSNFAFVWSGPRHERIRLPGCNNYINNPIVANKHIFFMNRITTAVKIDFCLGIPCIYVRYVYIYLHDIIFGIPIANSIFKTGVIQCIRHLIINKNKIKYNVNMIFFSPFSGIDLYATIVKHLQTAWNQTRRRVTHSASGQVPSCLPLSQ